jgi:hypothetical protein
MATRALQPGSRPAHGRALFGLLDANGWGWASLKAVFWFVLMIFLLGYVPDRAYYFTVNRTMDLGILAWAPVNFCPGPNLSLPCPAPVGAVIPWEPSPKELNLPQARTDGALVQSGTNLMYVGGSDGKAASASTFVAHTSGVGNFFSWADGPKLPEARSNVAVVFAGGKIYAAGGLGPDGKPTKSVYVLAPDSQTGKLGEWQTSEQAKLKLDLPEPRAGAVLVAASDGLLLAGGTDGTAASKTVWKSKFDTTTGNPGEWQKQPGELFQAVTDAAGAQVGDYLWIYGGSSGNGPVATVQRGEFGTGKQAGQIVRFGVKGPGTDLPAPRTNFAGFAANGALYVVGGNDASGAQRTLYWAIPNGSGDIPEWKHLDQSDLPASAGGLSGAAPIVLGPNVILVGGTTGSGATPGAVRANIAPEAPFFQLGLVGATVPALKIDGELGQQLGYLNANTIGIVNFAIFIAIGWAMAHRPQIAAWRDRRRRERELRRRAT